VTDRQTDGQTDLTAVDYIELHVMRRALKYTIINETGNNILTLENMLE